MSGPIPGLSRCPRVRGPQRPRVARRARAGARLRHHEHGRRRAGRRADGHARDAPAKEQVKGELLVVEKDRLYVRAEDGVREIPLGAVSEARVKRHGFGKSMAYAWSLIGGLAPAARSRRRAAPPTATAAGGTAS